MDKRTRKIRKPHWRKDTAWTDRFVRESRGLDWPRIGRWILWILVGAAVLWVFGWALSMGAQ